MISQKTSEKKSPKLLHISLFSNVSRMNLFVTLSINPVALRQLHCFGHYECSRAGYIMHSAGGPKKGLNQTFFFF